MDNGIHPCKQFRESDDVVFPALTDGTREIPVDKLLHISVGKVRNRPFFVVISQIHKVRKRKLVKLYVSDIYDPKLFYSGLISQSHLIPDLGKRHAIDTFITDGRSVIIKVIIHSETTLVVPVLLGRKAAGIGKIVIGQEEDDVFKLIPIFKSLRPRVSVIEVLNLFVNGEHLGDLLKIG